MSLSYCHNVVLVFRIDTEQSTKLFFFSLLSDMGNHSQDTSGESGFEKQKLGLME